MSQFSANYQLEDYSATSALACPQFPDDHGSKL